MIKVGITGQAGFIGCHLFNTLGLFPDKYFRINFEDDFFKDEAKLNDFVESCDVIIHLAAMNRHSDEQVIYSTNRKLVQQLIESCNATNSKPYIIFSSSTQEERHNLYGKSKREGRELFKNWAEINNACFSGLVIPNVFGPFGKPFYNSVVATFCHQLTHYQEPKIDIDGNINLIFVEELVHHILQKIDEYQKIKEKSSFVETVTIPYTASIKVSELLMLLKSFKDNYLSLGIFPDLNNVFIRNLFNTFVCYIDHRNHFPFSLKLNTDERGTFVETVKLNSGGQISFSTTKSGITRGNHFHIRKAERFAVIKGKAKIELRRIGTNDKITFLLDGLQPSFVDMPIWHTHNITNIDNDEVYTIFWISEQYDAKDPDTFFETV